MGTLTKFGEIVNPMHNQLALVNDSMTIQIRKEYWRETDMQIFLHENIT